MSSGGRAAIVRSTRQYRSYDDSTQCDSHSYRLLASKSRRCRRVDGLRIRVRLEATVSVSAGRVEVASIRRTSALETATLETVALLCSERRPSRVDSHANSAQRASIRSSGLTSFGDCRRVSASRGAPGGARRVRSPIESTSSSQSGDSGCKLPRALSTATSPIGGESIRNPLCVCVCCAALSIEFGRPARIESINGRVVAPHRYRMRYPLSPPPDSHGIRVAR